MLTFSFSLFAKQCKSEEEEENNYQFLLFFNQVNLSILLLKWTCNDALKIKLLESGFEIKFETNSLEWIFYLRINEKKKKHICGYKTIKIWQMTSRGNEP